MMIPRFPFSWLVFARFAPAVPALLLALAFAAVSPLSAAEQTQRLTWLEFGAATQDKEIKMVLPSGVLIQGKVLSVEPQALSVNVTKTSNRSEVGKGTASIPRSSVSSFETKKCGEKWRALLTIGLPAGLLAATAAAMNAQSPAVNSQEAAAVGLAVAGGSGVAGYFLGRSLDCRVTRIQVVP